MEQLTKETRSILISELEKSLSELELQKRIAGKAKEFIQSYKIDCLLLEEKIAKIKAILINGEFEY